jgi:hypothetical protein
MFCPYPTHNQFLFEVKQAMQEVTTIQDSCNVGFSLNIMPLLTQHFVFELFKRLPRPKEILNAKAQYEASVC